MRARRASKMASPLLAVLFGLFSQQIPSRSAPWAVWFAAGGSALFIDSASRHPVAVLSPHTNKQWTMSAFGMQPVAARRIDGAARDRGGEMVRSAE